MERALEHLEWSRIEQAIAQRRRVPGAPKSIPLASSEDGMARALGEGREAFSLEQIGEPLPLDGAVDVHPSIDRVERLGILEGPQISAIADEIDCARALRRFLAARRAKVPLLAVACTSDATLDALGERIRAAIDRDGTVSDRASSELARLRREVADIRTRVIARLEELIQKHSDILSDRYYTVRDGRYVLPVRTDAHDHFPGIVHGTSQSGGTAFVEPRALVSFGNRLKIAEGERDREELRIRVVLCEAIAEMVPSLRAAVFAIEHADLRAASARLARDFELELFEVDTDAAIHLKDACHPALLFDGTPVVANDIEIRAGTTLVISGPNAGGKTVALKVLGLASFMARAGLPAPARGTSKIGFFESVLTDVGDEQSLTRNLSTFSAHIVNVKTILERASGRSLVLLDELAGGTDPEEGAALACAIVDGLCRRGAATAVTTHYEALKALALSDTRMRNASVGLDDQMRPTFRVRYDVPGTSSALLVAERFGIPADVLLTARRVVPEGTRDFDALARKLEDQWRLMEMERAALAQARTETEELRARVDAANEELRVRDRTKLETESQRALDSLKKLQTEIRDARARTKTSDRKIVESLTEEVAELATAVQTATIAVKPPTPAGNPATPEALTIGRSVFIPKMNAQAVVVEPALRGRVRVAIGSMKTWLEVEEVRIEDDEKKPPPTARVDSRSMARAVLGDDPLTTIDLRGVRVDDALAMLDAALDRLFGQSASRATVLHGQGPLAAAVREHLARPSAYVSTFRAGNPDEGGDRCTIVHLR